LNLFLDIDAGPLGALGPFGFRAHAFAPGPNGINFRDAQGNLGLSSPFRGTPRTFEPVNLNNVYQLQVNALAAAAAARGAPISPALLGYMRSVLPTDPAFAALNLHALDPIANVRTAFDAASFSNVEGIQESTSSTFEVGYKGILGERLLLAADAWWEKKKNFTSPLITATPLILVNPTALAGFLVPRLTPVILAGSPPGTTPAQAQAAATQIATTIAQLPGGVISSPEAQGAIPELLVTYVNYGEIDINGMDFSATALLSDAFQLGATFSIVSDDHFQIPLAGDTQFVALNAPTKKGSAHLTYRNLARGLNGEVRVRYTDEFPANSAGYVGLQCVTGDPATGPCVDSYTLVDITAGYRLPIQGATIQLNIQNLFDEKYQSFVGTPNIGRLAILRLKYDL
jgi:outer membrane receptor for ferrienterochelin and colicins